MLNSYVRYEKGKTKRDYYHAYSMQIPKAMWKALSSIAAEKHCPISVLIRSYICEGLDRENYYAH